MAFAVANVCDFGALGDGSTIDTTAIQAAFDSVPSTGGHVYFPAGEYILDASVTCANKPILISGDGIDITILRWTGAAMAGANGIVYTNTQQAVFTLRDMSLEAQPNPTNNLVIAGKAVSITYPAQQTVHQPTVTIERVEISPRPTGNSWAPTNKGGWLESVYIENGGVARFVDCQFYCNINSGTAFRGIHLYASAGTNNCYVVTDRCTFVGFAQCVFQEGVASPGDLKFTGCQFVSCSVGIDIAVATDMLTVSGCYFGPIYTTGIKTNARTSIITGNRFDLDPDPLLRYTPSLIEGVVLGNGASPMDSMLVCDNVFGGASALPQKRAIRAMAAVQQSRICGNTIGSIPTYGVGYNSGIVLDAGSSGIIVEGNVRANCAAPLVRDNGSNNIVRRNYSDGVMAITGATPSLKSGGINNSTLDKNVYLVQSGPTDVTGFLNAYEGQELTIIAGDNYSKIKNQAGLLLAGGDFQMLGNNILALVYSVGAWRELYRKT